jgi:hypothetical protein
MSHFRVRREGMEFPVAGPDALQRLVREGTLGVKDRVWDPELDTWLPAGEVPLLEPVFAEHDQQQAARRARRTKPKPSILSAGGLSVLGPSAPSAHDEPSFEIPPDLESHSQELDPEEHSASRKVIGGGNLRGGAASPSDEEHDTDPDLGAPSVKQSPPPQDPPVDRGHVIEFPDVDPVRSQLSALPPFGTSLDPEQAPAALRDPGAFLRSADTPHPSQPKPSVRPSLVVMTVIVCLLAALLTVSYFQQSANMYNARQSSASGTASQPATAPRERGVGEVVEGGTDQPQQSSAPVDISTETLYERMELELRNRMVPGCSTIEREDDLDTALVIELSRLGVMAYSMHAPVLTWGGRKGDMPLAVEIKIWYEGQPGELDREIGAIGLLVGKYAQHYGLDVRAFEIYVRSGDDEPRKRPLDANAAKQFYLRRISLLEFLTDSGSGS